MLLAPLLIGLVAAAPVDPYPKRADVVYMTTTKEMGWAQLFGLGGNANTAPAAATTAPIAKVAPTTAPTTLVFNTAPAAVAPAAAAPAAATAPVYQAPAAAATTPAASPSRSGGFFSNLLNFFDGGSLGNAAPVASQAAPAPAPAATTQAPLQAAPTTAVAVAPSSSSGGWFSNLVSSLFGGSSNSQPAPAPAASTAVPVAPVASTSSQFGFANPSTLVMSQSPSSSVNFNYQGSSASPASNQPAFTGQVTVIGAGGPVGSAPSSSSKPKPLSGQVLQVVGYAEEGAGITYSPYTKSGLCKSSSQVADDIAKLLGFGIIRLYSVDCSGIQNVIAAMNSNQQLFLGIWDINNVNTDLPSMAQQVMTGSRGWGAVHTVAIGNEVVNSGRGTPAQVASAVNAAKSWFQSNAPNYSGPIVMVDTLAAVMANPQLMCDIGDYLAVNCHPYFSGVEASTSGPWLKSQVSQLQQTCGGNRNILVTESGWPTFGNTVGQAVPSVQNQLLSIQSLGDTMGSLVIMFTMYNDYWKAPGPWNVEQHWGIFGDPSA